MGKTSLIITSTAAVGGKKLQKTLTDINSSATNTQLKSFAQQIIGLTTNTYAETNRVDKINCDLESGGGSSSESAGKSFRNITITGAARSSTATITANVTSGGSVNPAPFYYSGGTVTYLSPSSIGSDSATVAKFTVNIPSSGGQLFVGICSNDYFYADFVDATVS